MGSPHDGRRRLRKVTEHPSDEPLPHRTTAVRGPALGLGPGTWPFVDRDHKLEAVLATLDGTGAGAVVVSGPHGAGRTRLAQEAVAALRARGRRAEWVTGTRGGAAI